MSLFQYIINIWYALTAQTKFMGSFEAEVDKKLAALQETTAQILTIVQQILTAVTPLPASRLIITISTPDGQIKENPSMTQITDVQSITFTLAAQDAKGQPAALDGTKTTASIDNTGVATVTLDPSGLSGTVTAVGVGTANLSISVTDATVATDVLTGSAAITVVAGAAATVNITFGTPTP